VSPKQHWISEVQDPEVLQEVTHVPVPPHTSELQQAVSEVHGFPVVGHAAHVPLVRLEQT
jgi:hypothetical protein